MVEVRRRKKFFLFLCFPFGSVDWEEWGQAKKVASPRKEAKEPQAGAVKQTIYGCVIPDMYFLIDYRPYASRLDEKNEWHNVLSHGEAQRLCFARVLLWYAKQSRYKKQALWLFLDEATSNLDVANEANLYSLLKGLPRLQWVSVAHRNLDLYHDVRLTLPSGVVENIP